MIQPDDHRPRIDELLKRYGLSLGNLQIVKSVQGWCREHSVCEENPFRIAKCLRQSDGTYCIVMAANISDDMISSAKGGLEAMGFSVEVASLRTDEDFLFHTVLHEIACKILDTGDQVPRSMWAFEQLKRTD